MPAFQGSPELALPPPSPTFCFFSPSHHDSPCARPLPTLSCVPCTQAGACHESTLRSPVPCDPSELGAHTLPERAPPAVRGLLEGRVGSVKPSSSLQPDLGAQRGKGQVLAVLHHRHGRWHEHLGREGEACPPPLPPPRSPGRAPYPPPPWQPPGHSSPSSLQKGPSVE